MFTDLESNLTGDVVHTLRIKAVLSAIGFPNCTELSEPWRLAEAFIKKHGFPIDEGLTDISMYWKTAPISDVYAIYESLLNEAIPSVVKPESIGGLVEKNSSEIENYTQQDLFG